MKPIDFIKERNYYSNSNNREWNNLKKKDCVVMVTKEVYLTSDCLNVIVIDDLKPLIVITLSKNKKIDLYIADERTIIEESMIGRYIRSGKEYLSDSFEVIYKDEEKLKLLRQIFVAEDL